MIDEETITFSHSDKVGFTFHTERDVVVMWHPDGAKCIDNEMKLEGDISWYGEKFSEQYTLLRL